MSSTAVPRLSAIVEVFLLLTRRAFSRHETEPIRVLPPEVPRPEEHGLRDHEQGGELPPLRADYVLQGAALRGAFVLDQDIPGDHGHPPHFGLQV